MSLQDGIRQMSDCPFCGHEHRELLNMEVTYRDNQPYNWVAICDRCGYSQYPTQYMDDAVSQWNVRNRRLKERMAQPKEPPKNYGDAVNGMVLAIQDVDKAFKHMTDVWADDFRRYRQLEDENVALTELVKDPIDWHDRWALSKDEVLALRESYTELLARHDQAMQTVKTLTERVQDLEVTLAKIANHSVGEYMYEYNQYQCEYCQAMVKIASRALDKKEGDQ